ncbi:MAG: hypothetical protein PVG14_04315 [Anaerolineales bacterium]
MLTAVPLVVLMLLALPLMFSVPAFNASRPVLLLLVRFNAFIFVVPDTFCKDTPPLVEEVTPMLSIVAAIVPPLMATPLPLPEIENSLTVNVPTLLPLRPAPMLVLVSPTLRPRRRLLLSSVMPLPPLFVITGRVPPVAGRELLWVGRVIPAMLASETVVPWPINNWLFCRVIPPLYAPLPL